jgi:hypothetical protein
VTTWVCVRSSWSHAVASRSALTGLPFAHACLQVEIAISQSCPTLTGLRSGGDVEWADKGQISNARCLGGDPLLALLVACIWAFWTRCFGRTQRGVRAAPWNATSCTSVVHTCPGGQSWPLIDIYQQVDYCYYSEFKNGCGVSITEMVLRTLSVSG